MHAKNLALGLLILAPAAWLQAQTAPEDVAPRFEVFAGGAFAGSNPSNASNGFDGGVDFRAWRWLAGEGEFSLLVDGNGGVGNSTTLADYLFGPRFSTSMGPRGIRSRFTVFVDLLAGGQTFANGSTQHAYFYANSTHGAVAGNSGLDVRILRHVALRGKGGFVSSEFRQNSLLIGNYRWQTAVDLVYRF
jgi:hypothetical protein